ncbi:MAG TPA: IPT/TIG domain-containing protein [Pseudomonadota bacterium]|nr:IPT/TIG domain-containing protein [Pseudomonadota bacterium]
MRKSLWGLALGFSMVVSGAMAGCNNETAVLSLDPPQGTYTGGEDITIKGRNFPVGRGGVSVLFGRHPATNVILESPSAIRVTSPAGDRNTKSDVTIMFDDGRAYQLQAAFQYLDGTDNSKVMKHFGNKK